MWKAVYKKYTLTERMFWYITNIGQKGGAQHEQRSKSKKCNLERLWNLTKSAERTESLLYAVWREKEKGCTKRRLPDD